MSPPTPRVFIIRHGETEWSLNGRHTGVTDIPLTANGERRIRATGRALVGTDRLIVPSQMSAILVSPRSRARRTLELLVDEGLAHHADPESKRVHGQGHDKVEGWVKDGRVVVREDVREWDYGRYEGWLTKAIQEERTKDGKGRWLIWKDGCPEGESPADVTARLDNLIAEIRQKYHKPALDHARAGGDATGCPPGDVLVVAHGHILRAFAARWIGRALTDNPNFLLEAGGVGTLSYEHHNIEEPAIMLGGAFMVEGEDER